MSDPTDYIKAWGVTRKAAEWAKAPQCVVDEAELRRRIREGWKPEDAITRAIVTSKPKPVILSKVPFAERPAELPKLVRSGKHSKYAGVSKRDGMWYAQIRETRYKVRYLGSFFDEISAAVAYDTAARPLGKKLNFPGKPDAGAR